MRKKAQKKIAKLVLNKDPNLLKSIEKRRGKPYTDMSGVAIYRWAKKLYRECAIKENWGK